MLLLYTETFKFFWTQNGHENNEEKVKKCKYQPCFIDLKNKTHKVTIIFFFRDKGAKPIICPVDIRQIRIMGFTPRIVYIIIAYFTFLNYMQHQSASLSPCYFRVDQALPNAKLLQPLFLHYIGIFIQYFISLVQNLSTSLNINGRN